MEYLRIKLLKPKKLRQDWKYPLGKVAYHAACHLRAQKIGAPGRILLSKIPDTEVTLVEECSAVDGTWGMKAQYYESGRKYARKLIEGVSEEEFTAVASDCPLSGQRIAKELGENLSDDELSAMIDEFDTDRDGEISLAEFSGIMKSTSL